MSPDDARSNEEILLELQTVTEQAIRSARIDHRSELMRLLDRRERLLAELWGFDLEQPLPAHGEKHAEAVQPVLSNREKAILKKVTLLDNRLLEYLRFNQQRLLSQQNELRKGAQVISGLRHLLRDGRTGGKRVDVRG